MRFMLKVLDRAFFRSGGLQKVHLVVSVVFVEIFNFLGRGEVVSNVHLAFFLVLVISSVKNEPPLA